MYNIERKITGRLNWIIEICIICDFEYNFLSDSIIYSSQSSSMILFKLQTGQSHLVISVSLWFACHKIIFNGFLYIIQWLCTVSHGNRIITYLINILQQVDYITHGDMRTWTRWNHFNPRLSLIILPNSFPDSVMCHT